MGSKVIGSHFSKFLGPIPTLLSSLPPSRKPFHLNSFSKLGTVSAYSAYAVRAETRLGRGAGTKTQLQMLMDIEKVSSFVKPDSVFIHFHSGSTGREGKHWLFGRLVPL